MPGQPARYHRMVEHSGAGARLPAQYRDGAKLSSRQRLHEASSTAKTTWHHFVFDLLPMAPGLRILEVGCGRGVLWVENGKRVDPSWALTLTDMSAGMVQETRQATRVVPCPVVSTVADVVSLPFADSQFDVVVANHMLYHVEERRAALAEIFRVLAPGGIMLAATNGKRHLHQIRELVGGGGYQWAGDGFDLDNGPGQIRPWFRDIRVVRHSNRLLVKDPELLIDYVTSMPGLDLHAEFLEELRQRIGAAIQQQGYWEVSPDSGVIVAERRSEVGG